MNIGKYIISEWKNYHSFSKVYINKSAYKTISDSICVISKIEVSEYTNSFYSDSGKYPYSLSLTDYDSYHNKFSIIQTYNSFYTDAIKDSRFISIEDGKHRIDEFLNKLSKLILFL